MHNVLATQGFATNHTQRSRGISFLFSDLAKQLTGWLEHSQRVQRCDRQSVTLTSSPRAAMNDLDDELDLRYHRGLKPDVYYRCPSSEVTRPLVMHAAVAKFIST